MLNLSLNLQMAKEDLDDFSEGCLGVNALHEVILKAVKHCNNVLMNEMIEEGDDRFITLD